MAFKIATAKRAKEDAQEIADYIYSDSVDAAEKWLKGFWGAVRSLQTLPLRFALIPESGVLKTPYRSCLYHSHRIIYRVDEIEKVVYIVRIYHVSRTPLQSADFD